MKSNMLQPIFYLGTIAILLSACTAKTLPNVSNANYQSYNLSGEKGYHVSFEVSHDSIPATAVVINKIKRTITPENKMGMVYKVDVIAESRKIFGFKPVVVDRENGIFFKKDSLEVFKAVDFKMDSK